MENQTKQNKISTPVFGCECKHDRWFVLIVSLSLTEDRLSDFLAERMDPWDAKAYYMSNLQSPDQEEAGLLKKFAAMRVCTCDCYQKQAFPRFDWSLIWMDGMPVKYNRGCPGPYHYIIKLCRQR